MKNPYLCILVTCIIVCFSISSRAQELNTRQKINLHFKDTIPGTFFIYDTTAVFDMQTYVETVKVTKTCVSAEAYFSNLEFSGKRIAFSDRLKYIESREENKDGMIKMWNTWLPVEIMLVFKHLNDEQKAAVFFKYAKS